MFPWNIAKSAEAIFSRWAIKHACKFLLKKKLGQFILGDIDLDQLDVQLGAGTIQLTDLALNVDYINEKFGEATVIVKEGSIGSLLVRIPWKGKSCQVEVDELELVLAPCRGNDKTVVGETSISRQDVSQSASHFVEKLEHEIVKQDSMSISLDVHEGVKTIAKMVKWLLTSFQVKLKRIIVAYDPSSEKDEKISGSHTSLVLRIAETVCGTCISEDANSNCDARVENVLGMSRLTNFVRFQGAMVELLQMDDMGSQAQLPCVSGTNFGEWYSGSCPSKATTPVLTGDGGFSGTLKLSIPWENGSLDIRKVDADVSIDPMELKFQPSTIKRLIYLWESLKILGKDGKSYMQHKAKDLVLNSASQSYSSNLGSSAIATDTVMPRNGSFSVGLCSLANQGVTDALLPESHLIPDWVPSSIKKNQKDLAEAEPEPDFGASIDQFFECFDGMRNSQSALGNSGMWNWTCSVFTAISAASNLASGSMYIPSGQQHVETNLKANISGISIVLSFNDDEQKHSSDLKDDQANVGLTVHYLGAKCRDVLLVLQICPQEMKFEAWLNDIELDDYFSYLNVDVDDGYFGIENSSREESLLIQHLQAEVQEALPPFPSSNQDSGLDMSINGMVNANFPSNLDPINGSIGKLKCKPIPGDDLVKLRLLKTSGVTNFHLTVNSSSSDDRTAGSTSFSARLPPFIFWVNFHLVKVLLDFLKDVGNSFEVNDMNKNSGSDAGSEKRDFSCLGEVKRETFSYVTTSSQKGSLRGSVYLPSARVILCFPFTNHGDLGRCSSWDQFIALDFSVPLSSKKIQDAHPIPDASSQKDCFPTASCSIYLNIGNLNIYFIVPSSRDGAENKSCRTYSAQNILSVTNITGCLSGISMFWQEGPVTGPWIAMKARSLATSEDSKSSRNEKVGNGNDFASVTAVKYLDNINAHTRQEMILSSTFFLYAHLSPVRINLCSSQYKGIYCLLSQVMDGLLYVTPDANAKPSVEEVSTSQTSFLVACDSVEIVISLDRMENIKCSMQKELPGSWHSLRLKIQKFEVQSVSNIGGISGASFVWVGHGEGMLWGSITGYPNQELLLISCSNSTMRRGDGEGANALSSGFAGSSIVHLCDPQSHQVSTSITVRCVTIVAPGGRLDWLNAISLFFILPSLDHDQAGHDNLQEGFSEECAPYGSSFVLNLVDIALSYEPRINHDETGEQYVSCLLSAASLNLSNIKLADSVDSDYKIRVQDLGLLLCELSGSRHVSGTYNVDYLRKIGYVKVAGDALIEAILRTNCKNGLLWEVDCSESHINLDTCHDTASGLICLASQLQQLFALDVEESAVYLQARWNNVKQAQARNDINSESKTFDSGSTLSPSLVHASSVDTNRRSGVVGLMDEICEDAFHLNGYQTSPSDSCQAHFHISLDEGFVGDSCNLDTSTPETSHKFSCSGSMPGTELENNQIYLQRGCFPEFIEGYYLSELRPLSEISVSNQSWNENHKFKSKYEGSGDVGSGNSGWYQDTSFRIVENHISKVNEHLGLKEFLEEGKLHPINSTGPENFSIARGRLVLKNIDIRWRMYAGSDWNRSGDNVQYIATISGRDTTTCLELALSGMDLQYDLFPDGEICVSKLSLSVHHFNLYDNSRDAPWKLVLGYYHSKNHPKDSSAIAIKLDLESVRPDPLTPLEEYRMRLALRPLLLHLHQGQLDFLTSFFGGKNSTVDPSSSMSHDIDGSRMSTTVNGVFGCHPIAEEALLPYFQKFDIYPILVRVDYSPCRVDLAALRGGKYVELINLVPWKGVELQLKHVHAVGIYGWNSVCETIVGEWLEDISQNQVHKLLKGLPTIRSLFALGSGAAKLVSLPVKNYRKDNRLLKGIQRGAIAFVRSISLEAVGLGVHLAAGFHDILFETECILTSIPPSVPCSSRNTTRTNVRSNQPYNAQQGIQQAYEYLSDGLGRTASALVGTPLKTYQRGAGAGSALASVVCAVPAAAIAPASAAARAVHCTLLGVRNSLDPEHKKESMEKYFGPGQHRGHT